MPPNKPPAKPPLKRPPSNSLRRYFLIAMVVLFGLAAIVFVNRGDDLEKISLSELHNQLAGQEVDKLIVKRQNIQIFLKESENGLDKPDNYAIRDGNGVALKEELPILYDKDGNLRSDVNVEIDPPSNSVATWLSVFINLVIPIGIIVFLFILFKAAQGQGSQALSFGRSKAKLYETDKKQITFKDVAGNEHAKEDLEEVVDFLKHPAKFRGLGAKIPKGVLLVGPPGTGKTMIARAVAGEAKVHFYSLAGSEFVEMFVGVGASRVRDLFTKAKKNSPAIIFIDEIDAVGRRRGSGMGGGHDEREQTLNQILVEMDGFEQDENVIVLAATNRADVLDPALLRPGRFDRRVVINLPDRKDRLAILKVHFKDKPFENIDLDGLAAKTAGSSGADLSNIVNEAAIRAARRNSKKIGNQDVVEAFEKVAIGPARKNSIMTDREKELTAYHEAGHAIVGHVLPDSDKVHKVTIVSRGHAGGVTWFLPPGDKVYHSIIEFKDVLARMLGGRVAEKIIYGSEAVTTGAGSDLQKATELARDMIMNKGMGSQELRDQVFHTEEGEFFSKMMHEKLYSETTAERIDKEILKLVREAAERAEIVIRANMKCLERMKDVLLDKETVEEDEILEIFKDSAMPAKAALSAQKSSL